MSVSLNQTFPLVLAPTGMIPTKEMTPYVPISPQEVISDVKACYKIGITSVHLHARDKLGIPTWEKNIFAEIIYGIREYAPDLAINVSTSGRNWSDLERRADCLSLLGDLKPDLASLTTSSLNFISGESINSPSTVEKLAKLMLDRNIVPELELFDLGMVNAVSILKKKGLLPKTLIANIFFGNAYGAQATPIEMAAMITGLPPGTLWSGAGIGLCQPRVHAFSLSCGGGVRTGLEDNLYLDILKQKLARNVDLVERAHKMGETVNREIMAPAVFKALLQ
jgi:3-keto-5-aminohexanoate cleavage enzyme